MKHTAATAASQYYNYFNIINSTSPSYIYNIIAPLLLETPSHTVQTLYMSLVYKKMTFDQFLNVSNATKRHRSLNEMWWTSPFVTVVTVRFPFEKVSQRFRQKCEISNVDPGNANVSLPNAWCKKAFKYIAHDKESSYDALDVLVHNTHAIKIPSYNVKLTKNCTY